MTTKTDADGIVDRGAVPWLGRVFVIGHRARQVTVYSQQVRALKLIWALDQQSRLEGQQIVVVGGGIAGVTSTTAAMLYGANVIRDVRAMVSG